MKSPNVWGNFEMRTSMKPRVLLAVALLAMFQASALAQAPALGVYKPAAPHPFPSASAPAQGSPMPPSALPPQRSIRTINVGLGVAGHIAQSLPCPVLGVWLMRRDAQFHPFVAWHSERLDQQCQRTAASSQPAQHWLAVRFTSCTALSMGQGAYHAQASVQCGTTQLIHGR